MPIPPRDTTVPVDTSKRNVPADSNGGRVTRDTIKAPLARAEQPELTEIGGVYRWDRRTLFSTGAQTLLDLLDRIPGLTGLRAGFLSGPAIGAYLGDVARIRLFYDGLELDAMNPRTSGAQELSAIQLWTLEELEVERGAGELRVYMRSWRVARTTPYTRFDISTGDLGVNMYRGYFGRRYDGGTALQTGFQYLSQSDRRVGNADALGLLARTGWAAGPWSADAYVLRTQHTHSRLFSLAELNADVPGTTLSSLEYTDTYAYLRAAYGDPDRGPWAQLLAGTVGIKESSPHVSRTDATSLGIPVDTLDTLNVRAQYVAAAGITRWGLRLSATDRMRVFAGQRYNSPSARASFDGRVLTATAIVERDGVQSVTRGDALARFQPLSFLAFSGAVGERSPYGTAASGQADQTTRSARAEAAVRVGRLWIGGGALARDSTYEAPASAFYADSARGVRAGQATGDYAILRGDVYHGVALDAYGIRWNQSLAYLRPTWQTYSRLAYQTNWLSRFPSGNFGVSTALTHEYRTKTIFPYGQTQFAAPQSHVLGFLLEIRILQADISYQFRNFLGTRYQFVPGFSQPRQSQIYGVRWEFWN